MKQLLKLYISIFTLFFLTGLVRGMLSTYSIKNMIKNASSSFESRFEKDTCYFFISGKNKEKVVEYNSLTKAIRSTEYIKSKHEVENYYNREEILKHTMTFLGGAGLKYKYKDLKNFQKSKLPFKSKIKKALIFILSASSGYSLGYIIGNGKPSIKNSKYIIFLSKEKNWDVIIESYLVNIEITLAKLTKVYKKSNRSHYNKYIKSKDGNYKRNPKETLSRQYTIDTPSAEEILQIKDTIKSRGFLLLQNIQKIKDRYNYSKTRFLNDKNAITVHQAQEYINTFFTPKKK